MSKILNIVFFSSSDFTIPLIQKLQQINSTTLQLAYQQEVKQGSNLIFNANISQTSIDAVLQKYGDYILNFKRVISASDKLNGSKLVSNPIVKYCQLNNIEYYNPAKLKDGFSDFKIANPGLSLGIVASYGQILTEEVLNTFEFGIINWHPSLLPNYRGPTPMQTVLANGDEVSGLSWINMTKGMDAGDVLLQTQTHLEVNWNIQDLSQNMVETGFKTLVLAIIANLGYKDMSLGLEIGERQDVVKISFTKMLSKNDRVVDPKQLSAQQIFNHFKAYKSFPGSAFYDDYFKQNVKIIAASQVINDLESDNFVSDTTNFVQIKVQNEVKTYLKTTQGLLELQEIMLENGKKIQLKGYLFKS